MVPHRGEGACANEAGNITPGETPRCPNRSVDADPGAVSTIVLRSPVVAGGEAFGDRVFHVRERRLMGYR